MNFQNILIQLAILLMLVIPGAHALDPAHERQNLAPLTEFFADESRRLTFRQVRELPSETWTIADTTTFSFGFTDVPYWFRVPIANKTSNAQSLILEIGYARFDSLEVFVSRADDKTERFISGIDHPYEARAIKHRQHVFPIELAAGEEVEVVIRAQTSGAFVVPLSLWHQESFEEADEQETLLYGAYFGVWLMILVFNTVLYTAVQNRALISFVAFVFAFGVYQLADLGFGVGYYWTESPGLYDTAIVMSIGLSTLSMMWLASTLLDLPTTNPIGHRVLQVFGYPALLCLIAYPLTGYNNVIPILISLSLPVTLTVLALGVWAAWQGNRVGLYSTIAWSVLLIGVASRILTRFDLLPLNFMTENAAPVGFILMIISLSFVVAEEIRRQARDAAGGILFPAGIDSNNRQLEAMVHDRTQELESALTELSQANETLREINTMDAVTGIKNRHYFDTIFEQEWKRASRQKYPISLMMLDIDHFKQVNDKFGHLAGDECLRGVAATISAALKRPADIIARYGGEEFIAVLPYIENENALSFADQIRSRVEAATYLGDGHEIRVTMSIGVCTVTPGEEDDRKDMISAADIALYEAKNSGRNRVCNAGQLTVHAGNAAG